MSGWTKVTSFLYRTLKISQSVSIAFYVFKYHEPGTLEVIDRHGGRFPLPPRTFWDLPNLKAAIKVDYGTPKDQNSWVKRNWSAVKKLIEDGRFVSILWSMPGFQLHSIVND